MTDIMRYNLAIIIKAQAKESQTPFSAYHDSTKIPKKNSIQQFQLLKARAIVRGKNPVEEEKMYDSIYNSNMIECIAIYGNDMLIKVKWLQQDYMLTWKFAFQVTERQIKKLNFQLSSYLGINSQLSQE